MKTYQIAPFSTPVSAIGLGTMIFHPDTSARDFALLDAFVENGGTYIDTAEVYGAVEEHGFSEMVIGAWLAARPGMRDRIVLSTKGLIPGYCAPLHPGGAQIDPASIHRAIEGSLERLKTNRIDLWMFHRDRPDYPVGPLIDALDEELRAGRIGAYGASNWSTARIQEAITYARETGKAELLAASPCFSLAKAREPYWPDTEIVSDTDKGWFVEKNFLMVAWSALGRGFFSRASPNDRSDADMVRVFYSEENFERKRRAEELSNSKGVDLFEIALAYVINQEFPVVALNGARTMDQVVSSVKAGAIRLSDAERNWLDLTSGERPF